MHIFQVLDTYCQITLSKDYSNLHWNLLLSMWVKKAYLDQAKLSQASNSFPFKCQCEFSNASFVRKKEYCNIGWRCCISFATSSFLHSYINVWLSALWRGGESREVEGMLDLIISVTGFKLLPNKFLYNSRGCNSFKRNFLLRKNPFISIFPRPSVQP